MKFTFTPSAKAFPDSKIMRTIDVEVADFDGSVRAAVNGKTLSQATVMHAVAFAIKQRLANSYVSSATAKNADGGLLPQKDREALWQGAFDGVLAKIVDPAAAPNWESVFAEAGARESVDPVGAEVAKIVLAKLRAWAKAKEKTLPKVDTDEYKALRDKVMAQQGTAIRAEAEKIVAARQAAVDGTDLELDLDE